MTDGSSGPARGSAGRRPAAFRWLPATLITLCLALVIPAWSPRLPAAGLDGSWVATLSDSVFSGRQFGTDLVYTFGPLGFLSPGLCTPRTCGLVLVWGLFCALVLGIAFAALASGRSAIRNVLPGIAFCFLFVCVRDGDALLFAASMLLLAVTAGKTKPRLSLAEILLVVMLSAGALMKLLHLVGGLWTVACAALLTWIDFRKLSFLPLVFATSTLALWVAMGQRLSGWGPYLRNSWEMTSGYTEAMALPGPSVEIVAILACLVLVWLAWRVVTRGPWRGRTWLLALAGGGVFFLSFKLGFVRHAGSRPVTPWMVLVLCCALALLVSVRSPAPARRRMVGYLALAICLTGLAGAVHFHTAGLPRRLARASRAPLLALRMVQANLRNPGWLEKRYRQAQRRIAISNPLPKISGSVDFFGNNSAILIAHGLDYTPRPVFQGFATYTAWLAELNGEFYRGPQAPGKVVVRLEGFHGPPAGFHDSEALLELLQSYKLEAQHSRLLVLKRARLRHPFKRRPTEPLEVTLGDWVSLDHRRAVGIWAEIEVSKTLPGAAAHLLLKLPALTLTARFADGREETFWFATKQGAGFLLSPVIYSNSDLKESFKLGLAAAPPRRVVTAFRIAEGRMVGGRIIAEPDKESLWRTRARVQLTRLLRPRRHGAAARELR